MRTDLIINADPFYFLPQAICWEKAVQIQPDLQPIASELFYANLCDFVNFDIRLINALGAIGIDKVHELIKLRKIDLLKAAGIGKKGRAAICSFLTEHDLVGYSEVTNPSAGSKIKIA